MQYIPNPILNTEEIELNLNHIYKESALFKINIPSSHPFLVLDSSHTLIGFSHQPLKNSKFYHPQPGTDFMILGQLYTETGETLPLLNNSYLLSCTVS